MTRTKRMGNYQEMVMRAVRKMKKQACRIKLRCVGCHMSISTIARLLVTWLLITLLLVPIIVVHAVEGAALRIFCIMIASGMFVFVLSDLMHARMAEIFVAGAT